MCVAVIEFIVCRIADVNDRDIKVQSRACEGMISVDGDRLSLNLRYDHDLFSPADFPSSDASRPGMTLPEP